jgi:phosphohistidine phosphatase
MFFMKKIVMVRHAKSSWANIGQTDFDRDLNDRGQRDATEMAHRLVKKINIDVFVSSPAKRAKKTCEAFCKVYQLSKDKIIFIDRLYHAAAEIFFQEIANLDDNIECAAIFSHNPGITDFVNTLCKQVKIDNMPTCATFAISIDIKSWKDFRTAEKGFLFFDYPKLSH